MNEDVKQELRHYCTPVYITDVATFSLNLKTFGEALRKEYANSRIGYSLKTNYHKPFVDAVFQLGEMAEIVSPMEYNKAMMSRFSYSDLIYNGVVPDVITKIRIAEEGGIVNFDNIEELTNANLQTDYAEVGVRLNFDIKNGIVSRFGIDVENRDDMSYLLNKYAHRSLHINKLHCHFSGARELYQFRRRVEKLAKFARMFNATTIDIGGNMFGVLAPEFDAQYECVVPSLEDYAHAIGSEMKRQFPDESVQLIVEGGTPFVTNAMHLLTQIRNVKTIRGCTYVTVDCRNEDVGWTCRYKEPVVQSLFEGEPVDCRIFGSECTETDIIRRQYYGPIETGGNLLIMDIGAYSSNLVNNFIKYGCRTFIDVSEIKAHIIEE